MKLTIVRTQLKSNNIIFYAEFQSQMELSEFLNENQGIELIKLI